MAPKVLVLWTGYPNGARVTRQLKRAGFDVHGAFPAGRPGGRSFACLRPLRYPSPVSSPDEFVAWVRETCARLEVEAVVPGDEDIVRLLSRNIDALGGAAFVGPTAEQYAVLCDKRALSETAHMLGLDSPMTVEVDEEGHSPEWPSLPSIVKPRTSGSEVDAPTMVETEQERDALVQRLARSGYGAIVQERIDGQRWVVQSVRGEGVFEYVVHRVDLEWPRGCGLATMKRPSDEHAALAAAAKRLLDHVDYRGPSGISFLEQDGRFYPHDVNLRLGATTVASVNAGFDFPRRAVEAVMGLPGRRFSGTPIRGAVQMRFDLELEALASAIKQGDRAMARRIVANIARVAVNPHGVLDPSPLNPFWVASLAQRVLRRFRRPTRTSTTTAAQAQSDAGADTSDPTPAVPAGANRPTGRSHDRHRAPGPRAGRDVLVHRGRDAGTAPAPSAHS